MKLGVIGLGNIGGHVAANLAADGHELAVLDLDPARVEALTRASGDRADGDRADGDRAGEGRALANVIAASDAAHVARHAETTFLSLPTPDAVEIVARDWLRGAEKGRLLVDLSTNAPETVRGLGARLEASGCALLEAPLTGGAPGARHRKLVFLCGGDPETFERCRPLLEKLGRAVFHLGELGQGNVAKLVNSLLAFSTTWVSLEGLALAAKAGLDLRTLVEVVRTGGASNFYMDRMVEALAQRGSERPTPTRFALRHAAKDAALIDALGVSLHVPLPVGERIAEVLEAASEGGLGERDWSALSEWMERQADVELALGPAAPAGPAGPADAADAAEEK